MLVKNVDGINNGVNVPAFAKESDDLLEIEISRGNYLLELSNAFYDAQLTVRYLRSPERMGAFVKIVKDDLHGPNERMNVGQFYCRMSSIHKNIETVGNETRKIVKHCERVENDIRSQIASVQRFVSSFWNFSENSGIFASTYSKFSYFFFFHATPH